MLVSATHSTDVSFSVAHQAAGPCGAWARARGLGETEAGKGKEAQERAVAAHRLRKGLSQASHNKLRVNNSAASAGVGGGELIAMPPASSAPRLPAEGRGSLTRGTGEPGRRPPAGPNPGFGRGPRSPRQLGVNLLRSPKVRGLPAGQRCFS